MWHSGYVVVPSSSGCCISVTLQVDPKVGWSHEGWAGYGGVYTLHVACCSSHADTPAPSAQQCWCAVDDAS